MKSIIVRGLTGGVVALAATAAFGQEESTNRVAAETDWSVFVESDPTECWSVSSPKETVNTKNDRVVAVRRGDILLFVLYRPGSEISGQVSFTGGYPFASGSTVTLAVGSSTFELFTDGEYAWSASNSDDAKIITALKRGTDATVSARSARGTKTKDTFSLQGFTAALEEAEKRCK